MKEGAQHHPQMRRALGAQAFQALEAQAPERRVPPSLAIILTRLYPPQRARSQAIVPRLERSMTHLGRKQERVAGRGQPHQGQAEALSRTPEEV